MTGGKWLLQLVKKTGLKIRNEAIWVRDMFMDIKEHEV